MKVVRTSAEKREKKLKFIDGLYEKFTKHKQIILVSLERVSSRQIQDIRKLLRERNGILVVGKNVLFYSMNSSILLSGFCIDSCEEGYIDTPLGAQGG